MEEDIQRYNIYSRRSSSSRRNQMNNPPQIPQLQQQQQQQQQYQQYQSQQGYNTIRACSTNEMRSTMGTFVYNTPKKQEKSSDFFKDTRVDSCSYVKGSRSPDRSYMAVPFYEKPLKTIHGDSLQRSTYKESMNNYHYKNKIIPYVGMGTNKPLERYNPNSYRNRLNTTNDFYYPSNKLQNISIGDRNNYHGDRKNVWKTTNMVEFPEKRYSSKFTNHSGIQAYRVQWDQYLKRKNS